MKIRIAHRTVRFLRMSLVAAVGGAVLGALAVATPASADSYAPINGAGSTWSQIAVDAWRADVRTNGLVVNFAGTGSTDGRVQYIQHTQDFAVTEIPFENPPEPGQPPEIPDRPYAYLPIVAGGTSFMYHVTVAGQLVRDLKLSGETLAKIFTGGITRWNDPAITADYGRQLPDVAIIPVVRSDGAGASAHWSEYMKTEYPNLWCPFAQENLGQPADHCWHTSFYPTFGSAKGQVGSNGVANYVSAQYGEGAIGYVEYGYAKRLNFPVVSMLNAAGYYVQPSAGNVAVALTKAVINPDLTQNLDAVYSNPDPRSYPLSSYSYMVVPISTASPFNEDKGKSLSTFINYFLCGGQQKAQILGYSPLPENLVKEGFKQVSRIPGAVASPAISDCDNPALGILQSAPQPDPCLKKDATVPCGGDSGSGGGGDNGESGGSGGNGGSGGSGGSGGTGSGGGGSGGTGSGGGGSGGDSGSGGGGSGGGDGGGTPIVDPVTGEVTGVQPAVDPATGEVVAGGVDSGGSMGVGNGSGGGAGPAAFVQPMSVPGSLPDSGQSAVLYTIAVLALIGAIVVPPILWARKH